MAETSKNKIYYNDDENSVADVLTDMKKMAESTDKAIENSKYDDAQIKKDISDAKKEQALKDTEQDNKIVELQTEKAELEKELKEAQEDFYQNSIRGQANGEYIHVEDSSNCRSIIGISGNHMQDGEPSPDHQSEIESVGSNINILPSNLFSSTALNGINYTNKDGIITVNGTATENSFYTKTITLKAGTYTLNGAPKGSAQDRYCLQAQGLGAGDFGSGQTFTIDTEKQVTLRIMVWKGITVNNIIFKPKLIKGTEVGEYSKYRQGCVKVTKCNKNLFDKDNITLSEKSYNLDDNGELIFQGSWRVVNYIKVKPNTTYTLSGVMIPNKWTHRISEYDAQLVHTKQNQKTFDGFHTFTTSSTTKYIRFNLISGNNGFDYDLSSIQLEENKKKTTLEQHEEQSYIMPTQQSFKSVRDIRDTFIKKDGKWFERHNIYRYLFTGNENFKELDNNSIFGMIVTENKAKIVSKNDNGNLTYCLSNRFVNNTQFNATKMSNKIAFSQWSDTQYLYLSKIKDSVDELKNYLAANETYVDYPLEIPIDLECTEEQSKILDELNNARTYKNVTNITTDSKAILSLDYAKDLETLLNNTQALAVNNASEGV